MGAAQIEPLYTLLAAQDLSDQRLVGRPLHRVERVHDADLGASCLGLESGLEMRHGDKRGHQRTWMVELSTHVSQLGGGTVRGPHRRREQQSSPSYPLAQAQENATIIQTIRLPG
jgi:hypothetical protein